MAAVGSINPLMSLFPNATSAKSATKSVTQQAQQGLVDSLLGSTDLSSVDPAGAALVAKIHNKIDARRKTLTQRGSDIITASNVLETAHKGTTSVLSHLKTIRALVAKTTSTDLSAADRTSAQASLKTELAKLDKEVGAVQQDGRPLLTGSITAYTVQTGDHRQQAVHISLADETSHGLGLSNLSLTSAAGASSALQQIDAATRSVQHQATQQDQWAGQLTKSADTLVAELTRLVQAQSALEPTAATQQASQTQPNDLLSAFLPSASLGTNAQQLLL